MSSYAMNRAEREAFLADLHVGVIFFQNSQKRRCDASLQIFGNAHQHQGKQEQRDNSRPIVDLGELQSRTTRGNLCLRAQGSIRQWPAWAL